MPLFVYQMPQAFFERQHSKAGASGAIPLAFQAVTQTGYKTWVVKILMAI